MFFFLDKNNDFLSHLSYTVSKYFLVPFKNSYLFINEYRFLVDNPTNVIKDLGAKPIDDFDFTDPKIKEKWIDDRLFVYEKDEISYYIWFIDDINYLRDAFSIFDSLIYMFNEKNDIKDTSISKDIYKFVTFYIKLYYHTYVHGGVPAYMGQLDHTNLYTIEDIKSELDSEKIKEMVIHRNTCIMETYKNFKQHLIDNPGLLLRALSDFS
jgi:hypothetical protein